MRLRRSARDERIREKLARRERGSAYSARKT